MENLSKKELKFSQKHLRLLSGLYGVLKPLDIIEPYRLEMGTKLENTRGKNLYQFWGKLIAQKLNAVFEQQGTDILVNLASNEYFKAVDKKTLKGQIIAPIFKDCKNGQYKVISFYAKKARGLMTRYILENKIKTVDVLKNFDSAGYYFSPEMTVKENEPVFIRAEQVK